MPGVKHLGKNTWVETLIEDRESLAAVPAPDGQLPSGEKGLHTTGRQTRLGPFNAISTAAVECPILGIIWGTTPPLRVSPSIIGLTGLTWTTAPACATWQLLVHKPTMQNLCFPLWRSDRNSGRLPGANPGCS